MVQGGNRFRQVKGGVPLQEDPLPAQPEEELAARQKVHENEQLFAGLEGAVHPDDEGVVDLFQDVPLGLDVLDVPGFLAELPLGNDLHGQNLLGLPVSDLQDLPEGSHPDNLEKLEVLGANELIAAVVGGFTRLCLRRRRIHRRSILGDIAVALRYLRGAIPSGGRKIPSGRCDGFCVGLCGGRFGFLEGFSDECLGSCEVFEIGIVLAFVVVVVVVKTRHRCIDHVGRVHQVAGIHRRDK
mmetsp:Transcript_10577/g.25466  ORF Transcript_10577/g.25466 Transcript_10577/m.25466 type:complete len:241 (-) Transcript_10577:352-1074(-)